ncbi:MAG: hypothetical protein V1835_01815 [Candidatus Micrarchaeota archaeon]
MGIAESRSNPFEKVKEIEAKTSKPGITGLAYRIYYGTIGLPEATAAYQQRDAELQRQRGKS